MGTTRHTVSLFRRGVARLWRHHHSLLVHHHLHHHLHHVHALTHHLHLSRGVARLSLLIHHAAAHHSAALHHRLHHGHPVLHFLTRLVHRLLTLLGRCSAHHLVVQRLHLLHMLVHLRHRRHRLRHRGLRCYGSSGLRQSDNARKQQSRCGGEYQWFLHDM